jgi:hypothetical protein
MQDLGGGGREETERGKQCCYQQKVSSMVVSQGYHQDTKTHVAEDASMRVG